MPVHGSVYMTTIAHTGRLSTNRLQNNLALKALSHPKGFMISRGAEPIEPIGAEPIAHIYDIRKKRAYSRLTYDLCTYSSTYTFTEVKSITQTLATPLNVNGTRLFYLISYWLLACYDKRTCVAPCNENIPFLLSTSLSRQEDCICAIYCKNHCNFLDTLSIF